MNDASPVSTPNCPECVRLRKEVEELKALVRKLLQRLNQNSSNSSIPPSANLSINHISCQTEAEMNLLNVSRPFLVQQLDKGLISYRKVGSHRRLRLKEVLQYKQSMDQKRHDALDQLSEVDQ